MFGKQIIIVKNKTVSCGFCCCCSWYCFGAWGIWTVLNSPFRIEDGLVTSSVDTINYLHSQKWTTGRRNLHFEHAHDVGKIQHMAVQSSIKNHHYSNSRRTSSKIAAPQCPENCRTKSWNIIDTHGKSSKTWRNIIKNTYEDNRWS